MLYNLKRKIEDISGYWIFKKRFLPVGTDLKVDLDRLHLLKSKVVFDIGANIGQTANHYTRLFPFATIYSFEPVKKTFHELQKNTQNLNRVKVFNLGFGERDEQIEITLNPNPTCSANSLKPDLMNKDPMGIKEILDIRTINSFCSERNISEIDLLKIDTEGWEIQTLLGAHLKLSNHKIKAVLCEVGFTNENIRNTSFSNMINFMSENGYYFVGLYDISLIQIKTGCHYGNALFVSQKYLNMI